MQPRSAMRTTRIVAIPDGHAIVMRYEGDAPDCELAPRKYERRVSRNGGTSGGLGRGARGFWSKVKKVGHAPGGCWEWIGYLDKDGYGKFTTTRALDGSLLPSPRTFRPHRALYEHLRGPIPDGLYLLHGCDNARCVNPWHQRPGTQQENIRECYERGRHKNMPDNRGEMSPRTKLRNEDVLFIRSQVAAHGLVPVLAALFGVNKQVIACIRCRKTWKHIGNGNAQNAMPLAELRDLVVQRAAERESIDEYATARASE